MRVPGLAFHGWRTVAVPLTPALSRKRAREQEAALPHDQPASLEKALNFKKKQLNTQCGRAKAAPDFIATAGPESQLSVSASAAKLASQCEPT